MARSVGSRDQSGDDPNPDFAGAGPAQYSPSTYPFPIDSQLTMTSTYGLPPYGRPLAENPIAHAHSEAASDDPLSLVGPNGTAAPASHEPAMAPPHGTPQPPYMPSASRASVDDLSETGLNPQSGDKRKRSKTSRACDECRRKKVRCDAPTEADGTPKTCSNCVKAGTTCDFERKPMKRGPSKGYIKELAERVQQVEHVQKQAFRHSLDAASAMGPYVEPFSPEESTPAKHTLSFSEQRNQGPFAPAEFQRDRIPSSGFWGLHTSSFSRSRDLGSVALAPDQSVPTSSPEGEKVRAVESLESTLGSHRAPTDRRRVVDAAPTPFDADPTFLTHYYEQIHPLFPLLPAQETVVPLLPKKSLVSYAFATAIELLPYPRPHRVVNGSAVATSALQNSHPSNNRVQRRLRFDTFESYSKLVDHLQKATRVAPAEQTVRENLALAWTLILLALGAEIDMNHANDRANPRGPLEHALLLIDHVRARDPSALSHEVGDDRVDVARILDQAFACADTLAKYQTLGLGLATEPLLSTSSDQTVSTASFKDELPEASFLFCNAFTLSGLVHLLSAESNPREVLKLGKAVFTCSFQAIKASHGSLADDNATVTGLRLLVDLMITRSSIVYAPFTVPLAAEKLRLALVANDARATPSFSFLDLHLWTILVITFCECALDSSLEELVVFSKEKLSQVRRVLQARAEAFHHTYGFEWFYAGDDGSADEYETKHWSDCLLAMIDWTLDHAPVKEAKGGDQLVPNSRYMLRTGWIQMVSRFTS